MTHVLKISPRAPDPDLIQQAAAVIQRRGLVAFPTETVYGLGANALDEEAAAKIFAAKGRPSNDPLIVHLASFDDVSRVAADVPAIAQKLAEAFWPGPLTLILPKQSHVPNIVTAGLNSVAVRVPAHPVAHALIRASNVPIAAPSANRFGHTSPTTAAHVFNDLNGRIDMILDGGGTTVGVESTVLDVTQNPPVILRPGGVTREALENVIGMVQLRNNNVSSDEEAQVSPGLLGRHYTPHAELILCMDERAAALEKISALAGQAAGQGRSVGLLLANEDVAGLQSTRYVPHPLGSYENLEEIARNLYAGMRALDDQKVDLILTRDFGSAGLGLAIRDRLKRAASREM